MIGSSTTRHLWPCGVLLLAGALYSQVTPDTDREQQGPSNRQARRASAYIARKVWQGRIQAPVSPRGNDPADLMPLIEKLRAAKVQLDPQGPTRPVDDMHAPASDTAPGSPVPVTVPAPLPESLPALRPARDRLSPETLALIEEMGDQKLDAILALQLADILYQSHQRDKATPFYKLAAETLDPNAPLAEENRAWALFQLGNCLREREPSEAILAYQRLTTEYPSAPWTSLATMWHDLASWYWQEKPLETLEQVTQPLPEAALDIAPVGTKTNL